MNWETLAKANESIRTTNIKGKDYAEVTQRIKAFRMVYPDGFIMTDLLSDQEGVCHFKATCGYYYDTTPVILGTGHAYEKESSSFINKTSYIENCVPLGTQILTRDGWKYYYQLKVGEEVLSYNEETSKNEFCNLIAVNVYKNRPIVEMSSSRFCARCTPQHKWLAKTQYKSLQKVATEGLSNSWKIVQAVEQDVTPSKLGRQLGWLMCDCDLNYTADGMASTGYISQSKHYYDVDDLFGPGHAVKTYNDGWLQNYEWIIPAEEVRRILGYFGMATYKDLPKAMLQAELDDVAGCYQSMMLADGASRGFSSTYPELIEAVQIMCARLGIATTFVTNRMVEKSTRPIYTLGIKTTDGAWFSELEVRNIPPQDVWCPTTENGTWFMRQNGFVTLTSNCETSAVGRALGMAGFGIDTSVASAEEMQNAIINQVKDEPPEMDYAQDVTPAEYKAKKKEPVTDAQLDLLMDYAAKYPEVAEYIAQKYGGAQNMTKSQAAGILKQNMTKSQAAGILKRIREREDAGQQ